MRKVLICLLTLTLIVGCAGTAKKSESTGSCAAPSKTYGNAELDNFLQTSFDICSQLQEAQELLSETNEFIADPGAYIAKKGSQAKAELRSKISKMIASIPEQIIKKAANTLKISGNATSAAKEVPGMDKMKAVKDVNGAVKNLKMAGELAPKIVDELEALAAKF